MSLSFLRHQRPTLSVGLTALAASLFMSFGVQAQDKGAEVISVDDSSVKVAGNVLTFKFKLNPPTAKVAGANWSYRVVVDSPTGAFRTTKFITQDMIGPMQTVTLPAGITGTLFIEVSSAKPPVVVRTLPIKVGSSGPPWQQMIQLINDFRASEKKPPLVENAKLRDAASFHCKEMIVSGLMTSDINGSTLDSRLRDRGFDPSMRVRAEILSNVLDPQEAFNQLIKNPSNRKIFLLDATDIGAFRLSPDGQVRWTIVILDNRSPAPEKKFR